MTVTATWTSPAAAGTLDLAAGAVVTEAVWDAMVSNFLWLGGTTAAFGDFTPTCSQGGALTLSEAVGRYWKIGKAILFSVNITINSTGSGANAIVVGGLPVNSAQKGSSCFGIYADVTGATLNYSLTGAAWASATSINLASGIAGTQIGISPAVTAAATDVIRLTGWYEAA